MRRPFLVIVGVTCAIAAGGALWLGMRFGLDQSDKIASIAGAAMAFVGLAITVYTSVAAGGGSVTKRARQRIGNNSIGGDAIQIAHVRRGVDLTSETAPVQPSTPPTNTMPTQQHNSAHQSIIANTIRGSAKQFNDVGEDHHL